MQKLALYFVFVLICLPALALGQTVGKDHSKDPRIVHISDLIPQRHMFQIRDIDGNTQSFDIWTDDIEYELPDDQALKNFFASRMIGKVEVMRWDNKTIEVKLPALLGEKELRDVKSEVLLVMAELIKPGRKWKITKWITPPKK